MADFLASTRADIDKRISELKDELRALERARDALGGARRGPGRPRGSGRAAASGNGRRRRRGRRGGTRAEQALDIVRQNPGITVADLAGRMKVPHKNYLYRVMNGLQSDGAVKKQGRGFVAS
jgi:hypothetical protein